jgi:hypothetical protein
MLSHENLVKGVKLVTTEDVYNIGGVKYKSKQREVYTIREVELQSSQKANKYYFEEGGYICEKDFPDWILLTNNEVKYDKGKRRMDLLPWDSLDMVADVLTMGEAKYPSTNEGVNWLVHSKKEDITKYKSALLRHYSAMEQGEIFDTESKLPHMSHVATNSLFILALEKKYGLYDV